MADFPSSILINEEGPREGFQIERGDIPTERKVALIDALSETGLKHIQIVSFVNPQAVPGMADAEDVVARITRKPGVAYTGLWLNERGLERAMATGQLEIVGSINLSASDGFLKRNQNRTPDEQLALQHKMLDMYAAHDVPIQRATITAAFGCNFEGDIPTSRIIERVGQVLSLAQDHGVSPEWVSLADTMAWATPLSVRRVVGAVREHYPDLKLSLHLHDTRGMGIACAYAGLEMGVGRYDAAVGGLGGCPFAGHKGAAGNVSTEDLVFMCDEMGIETGIDLNTLTDCAALAEEIVGHPLPGAVMKGGSLQRLREQLAAGA
jgi:hydroxymethylglutaryl-CoA lyase